MDGLIQAKIWRIDCILKLLIFNRSSGLFSAGLFSFHFILFLLFLCFFLGGVLFFLGAYEYFCRSN